MEAHHWHLDDDDSRVVKGLLTSKGHWRTRGTKKNGCFSWDLSNFCGDYTDFTDFMVIHREFTNQKLPSGVGKRRDF